MGPRAMSDNLHVGSYYRSNIHPAESTVSPLNSGPEVRQLRCLLHNREHEAFLVAFMAPPILALARGDTYIRALGGEGLCLLLEDSPDVPTSMLCRYESLLVDGALLAPGDVVIELAERLGSDSLRQLGERFTILEHRMARLRSRGGQDRRTPETNAPVLEMRRFVQSTFMEFSTRASVETLGMRRSVFRSDQERAFMKALAVRFPALLALPNYPLDQFAELSRLRVPLGDKAWMYGKNCRVDALLVVPDEGAPVAAFELDSNYHDQPGVRERDEMKNAIFKLLGMPFFRLRVASPGSVSSDEWYSILTDEVVPRLDLGRRFRVGFRTV